MTTTFSVVAGGGLTGSIVAGAEMRGVGVASADAAGVDGLMVVGGVAGDGDGAGDGAGDGDGDGDVAGDGAAGRVAAGWSASCAYTPLTASKDTNAAARPLAFSRPDMTAEADATTGCEWISPRCYGASMD